MPIEGSPIGSVMLMKKNFLFFSILLGILTVMDARGAEVYKILNDSIFYSDGIYYQLIADREGAERNALCVVAWDPEIEELDIPEEAEVPDEMFPDTPDLSSISPNTISRGTRKYKIITWFKPKLVAVPLEEYKVRKIQFAMDIEIDGDFASFKYLKELNLPANMKSIPPRMFKNCKALTGIRIKKLVETVGEEAFAGCTSMTWFDVEGTSLSTIGKRAFSGCTELRDVDLGGVNGVRWIDSRAFEGCTSLTSIRLPSYCSFISKDAFLGCDNLTSINLDRKYASSEYDYYYESDGAIYHHYYTDDCRLWIVPPGKRTIVIDNNANKIESFTFKNNPYISAIYIPDNISEVGEGAFMGCVNLNALRLSERLSSIPDSMVYGCSKLEALTLPESVLNIGSWAFANCDKLESLNIPSQVKSIGVGVFADSSIKDLTVSPWNTEYDAKDGMLYHIGYKNAYNVTPYDRYLVACPGGKDMVTIDEETIKILDYAFTGCRNIETIHIPKNTHYVSPHAFTGCDGLLNFSVSPDSPFFREKDGVLLKKGLSFNSISIESYPKGREEADLSLLIDKSELDPTTRVTFQILNGAFAGNKCLKTLRLPDDYGVEFDTGNDNEYFLTCPNIENIYAYFGCPVYSNNEKDDIFHKKVYDNALVNIYVDSETLKELPEEVLKEYISDAWRKFKNINFIELSGFDDIIADDNNLEDYHIEGGEIIMNSPLTTVEVYNFSGRKVGVGAGRVSVPSPGLYILKSGNRTCKVLVGKF